MTMNKPDSSRDVPIYITAAVAALGYAAAMAFILGLWVFGSILALSAAVFFLTYLLSDSDAEFEVETYTPQPEKYTREVEVSSTRVIDSQSSDD